VGQLGERGVSSDGNVGERDVDIRLRTVCSGLLNELLIMY
jgi:hypothetical protein